jgi:hypothetical protein
MADPHPAVRPDRVVPRLVRTDRGTPRAIMTPLALARVIAALVPAGAHGRHLRVRLPAPARRAPSKRRRGRGARCCPRRFALS